MVTAVGEEQLAGGLQAPRAASDNAKNTINILCNDHTVILILILKLQAIVIIIITITIIIILDFEVSTEKKDLTCISKWLL